jgi:hypothetical protein
MIAHLQLAKCIVERDLIDYGDRMVRRRIVGFVVCYSISSTRLSSKKSHIFAGCRLWNSQNRWISPIFCKLCNHPRLKTKRSSSGVYRRSIAGGNRRSTTNGYILFTANGYRSSTFSVYRRSIAGVYRRSIAGVYRRSIAGVYRRSIAGVYWRSIAGGNRRSTTNGFRSSTATGYESSILGGYRRSTAWICLKSCKPAKLATNVYFKQGENNNK